MDRFEQYGRVAYEEYARIVSWKAVSGKQLPGWDGMDPAIRDAWSSAARCALQTVWLRAAPVGAADGDAVPVESAYWAYGNARSWNTVEGPIMRVWEDQTPEIQRAWRLAVAAVLRSVWAESMAGEERLADWAFMPQPNSLHVTMRTGPTNWVEHQYQGLPDGTPHPAHPGMSCFDYEENRKVSPTALSQLMGSSRFTQSPPAQYATQSDVCHVNIAGRHFIDGSTGRCVACRLQIIHPAEPSAVDTGGAAKDVGRSLAAALFPRVEDEHPAGGGRLDEAAPYKADGYPD